MYKAPRIALFAASLFVLVFGTISCSSDGGLGGELAPNPAPCPNILVLSEAGRMVEFDGEQSLENIAYSAEITDVSIACRYFDDKPITGSLEVEFALGKGPKGASNQKDYTFFVAVTRRDLEVIGKREFKVRGSFNKSRNTVLVKEKINKFIIPRASDKTSGSNFEVVVGLALTRDQVIYNRSGKSLKFPNL